MLCKDVWSLGSSCSECDLHEVFQFRDNASENIVFIMSSPFQRHSVLEGSLSSTRLTKRSIESSAIA